MSDYEPLTFTTDRTAIFRDGDRWPKRIALTLQLIRAADPRLFVLRSNGIAFTCQNGLAFYRPTGWDGEARALVCELVSESA